jgi:hypothetical protein
MRRHCIFLLCLSMLPGIFLAGGGSGTRGTEIKGKYHSRAWSDTVPAIDLIHIFAGEVNRRGRPVGFHSRPGGEDPQGSGLVRVVDRPNRFGVYTALVWIGRRSRTKFSTFYPDRLPRARVIEAILFAYRQGRRRGDRFSGPSGHGFTIEGYVQNGRIRTAYPLYSR